MVTRCLICNSSAVMSKDAAKAIALLIGALDGFLQGMQNARSQPGVGNAGSPLEQAFSLMLDGLSGATVHWDRSRDFIRDVQRYQFMEYDCFCLRCGARYDAPKPGTSAS